MKGRESKLNLPDSHDGIGNEDQEDDKGFNEGGDGLFTFLKPGQHLRTSRGRITGDAASQADKAR